MERMFYSCQEVADRYGVKISTVWAWVREKKLPAIKIGKIYKVRKEDLEKFETQNLTVTN